MIQLLRLQAAAELLLYMCIITGAANNSNKGIHYIEYSKHFVWQ